MGEFDDTSSASTGWIISSGAGAGLLLLGVAGYFLYLHAGSILQHGHALPPLLLLTLALIGGAASFFSPCSIVMTPAFLAYLTLGTPDSGESSRTSRPLMLPAALMVALGIVLFYAMAGIVIGAIGNIAYNYLIYFIPVVGIVFLLLGALMLSRRGVGLAFLIRWNPLSRFYTRQEEGLFSPRARGKGALVSFGFAYGAASHSCSLPIFLGILLIPLVAGNYPLAALSVLLYGLAIALLLVIMMVLGRHFFTALRRVGPWLTRVTAVLFLGTGVFLLAYFGRNFGAYRNAASTVQTAPSESGPTYSLVVGADATGYPYQPRVLHVPVRHAFRVAITDHVGGCLLNTVFEGLTPQGGDAEVVVPVGQTRTIALYAPHPGYYAFHCGENMYSGTVIAR